MKKIVMIVVVLFLGVNMQAQERKNKNAKYTVNVNGNCEQCKKRIEKASYAVSGVKSAIWDVDSHDLKLILNEQKSSLLEVEKAIAKVGHDTQEVRATQEDYDNLHTCCLYERK
ncbi:heavy-metal-associated domain-containing protein [Flavobacterium muglaense]|uniref:Metal transporter n=1 Tax=Flavobacterium muglaense TaxID=2764716 RepID=A0A923SES2_9FLAO|nr:metal transporter [Flavobacterium muglaense]MBC5836469.1 metal transporter [Flavobacterium muglaense]MBC5842999.1 metal transporter [Flavobacterium muglaense]